MFARSIALGLLLLFAACSSSGSGGSTARAWSIGFDEASDTAQLATLAGKWDIIKARGAPSGNRVLAQRAKSKSAGFNVVLFPDIERRDLDISVAMRAMAGEIDQGGGPLWRVRDVNNYYIVRYNPLEDNYRLYTVVNGKRTQLASANIAHTPGWHTLRVTMTGDHIRCYYDGELSLEVHDTTFPAAGQVGLWTKADAQTQFDDLRVR